MAKHSKQTFRNQTVVLDGNEFEQCVFEGCTLEYQGVKAVALTGNVIDNCQWTFKGPAANAVQFMGALYGSGQQGALLVETTFNTIRGLVPGQGPQLAAPAGARAQ
jgi:hypothetical protein